MKIYHRFTLITACVIGYAFFFKISAQTPCATSLTTNISLSWDDNATPEVNVNAARRAEETALGLSSGQLGDMVAPAGGWASLSDAETALYVHNAERLARGCMPVYGVETHLSTVATDHTNWMVTNQVFSHAGSSAYGNSMSYNLCANSNTYQGSAPWDRIEGDASIASCWEGMGENLGALFGGSYNAPQFNNAIPKLIYTWMYKDASSGWGHRNSVLMSFNNDYGDTSSEGFIGLSLATANNFSAKAFNNSCSVLPYVKILTVMYYDAWQGATCGFTFSAILPVELLSFSCTQSGKYSALKWETATEKELSCFLIERSADGVHFDPTGKLQAAGNSDEEKQYEWTDRHPLNGANFYRLAMVDKDGSVSYSRIEMVAHGLGGPIAVVPNPATDHIRVIMPDTEDDVQVTVFNSLGSIVLQTSAISDQMLALPYGTAPGMYIVHLVSEGQQILTQKLMIR